MKTLLDRMDNAYLHGEDYTPYDFEFHSMIAQCTGNDVMMRLLPTIHESIQAGYHHTRRVEGSYQRASQCHLEMYRANHGARQRARASGSPAAHDADDARLRRRGAVRAGEVRETFEALPRSPAGT